MACKIQSLLTTLILQAIHYTTSLNTIVRLSTSNGFNHRYNRISFIPRDYHIVPRLPSIIFGNIDYFMYSNMPYTTRSSVTLKLNQKDNDNILSDESNGVNTNVSLESNILKSKTVLEIKEQLRARGLKVSGRKEELINRLLDITTLSNATSLLTKEQHVTNNGDNNIQAVNNKYATKLGASANYPSTPMKSASWSNTKSKISNIVTPDAEGDISHNNLSNKRRRVVRNINTAQKDDQITSGSEEHVLSTSKYKKVSIIINNNINTAINDKRNDIISTPTNNDTSSATSNTKETTKKSPRKLQLLTDAISPPDNWESTWSLVEELRKDKTAPVDYVGAEALPERHRGEIIFRFQVLICLMLSSQTKDAVVGETIRKLQEHGLDVQTIQKTSVERINELIFRVGFHNNKSKFIKQTADILSQDYNGDIPNNVDDILTLPGVGPKMAYIIENIAFNRTTGIGVDTHMHRIFNQISWVNTKTPEQTRKSLELWLPKEKWPTVNKLFVGFGQESQQQKSKIIKKAFECSRPYDAIMLLKKVGLDIRKECCKLDLIDNLDSVLSKKE